MGRVYAVASGKGGVGKTTTTANLGAALARAGHETAVVDADLGMANLAAALGVDDEDGPTLHDVLAGEATVADAIREAPDRPAVLPGSRDLADFAGASPEGLADVLGTLAEEYEHVVVDTGAGLSTDSLEPLRAADEVVLVSTPDPAALDDTAKTAAVTRRLGTPLRGYVVVRARGESVERARDRLDGEVLGTIPDDPVVTDALAAGMPLAEYAPRSPATGAYRRLAVTLTGVTMPEADAERESASETGETPVTPEPMEGSPDPDDPATEPTAEGTATDDPATEPTAEGTATDDPGAESNPGDPDRDDEAGGVAFDAEGAPDPADGPSDPDDGTGVLVEPAEDDRSEGEPTDDDAGTAVEDSSGPETAPGDADGDGAEDADGPSPDEGVAGGDGTAGTDDEGETVDGGTEDDEGETVDGGTEDDEGETADRGEGGEGVAADDPDEVTIEADEGTEGRDDDGRDEAEEGSHDGSGQSEAPAVDDEGDAGADGDVDDEGDAGADGDVDDEGDAGADGDGDEGKKGFLRRLFG